MKRIEYNTFYFYKNMSMLYSKMVPIELAREQSDLLYHLFVNTNTSTLDDICNQISIDLKTKYTLEEINEIFDNENYDINKLDINRIYRYLENI